MNRYLIIHRLRWPALLLLTGVIALLDQADILSWGRAWPLYLILLGVLALAERATIGSQPPIPPAAYSYTAAGYPPPGYTGTGYPNAGYPAPGYPNQAYPNPANPNPLYGAQQPGYAPAQQPAAPAVSQTGLVPVSPNVGLTSTHLDTNREEEER